MNILARLEVPDTFREVPTSVTRLDVPDTFSEVPAMADPNILELIRFARLEVPDTLREVPVIPVPNILELTIFTRLEVPDMYTLPSTSSSVSENRAPSI